MWLQGETYDKLAAYADGRHYHRGEPELASCVRELLEHALACPYKYQTQNIPLTRENNNGLIENVPTTSENNYEQIETVSLVTEDISRQIENVPHVGENNNGLLENSPSVVENINGQIENGPAFDTVKYRLGKLCSRGHAYHDTGQSLRVNNKAGYCLECNAAQSRKGRVRKRQAHEGVV